MASGRSVKRTPIQPVDIASSAVGAPTAAAPYSIPHPAGGMLHYLGAFSGDSRPPPIASKFGAFAGRGGQGGLGMAPQRPWGGMSPSQPQTAPLPWQQATVGATKTPEVPCVGDT